MRKIILGRTLAWLIGIAALLGDALLLHGTVGFEHRGWLHGLWTDCMFFSDLSTLLIAVVFMRVGLGSWRMDRPWWLGLSLSCILLTAIGAQGWRGVLRPLTGNTIVHTWVPLTVVLWCLFFTVKHRLRWGNALTWTLVPLAYLTYALLRGTLTKTFAYTWLNPSRVGVKGVLLNSALQLVTFLFIAVLLITADRFWPQPHEKTEP